MPPDQVVPRLTGWAGGSHAAALVGKSRVAIRDAAVRSLAFALHLTPGDVGAQVQACLFHDWNADPLAREVVGFVHRLREADLIKVPGIAETLDWAAALMSLGARELSPELVDETLGVVLKYEEDIRQLRGEQTKRMLTEVAARG